MDEEIVFHDVESQYLPPHLVMTTWHPGLNEGLEFAVCIAHHSAVRIEEVTVLDLTKGAYDRQIKACVDSLVKP